MQLPLRIDASSAQPLQLQIFEQIRRLIIDGRLRAGVQVPASRTLATDLRVSRNTVVLAYDRLVAEGYLEMRHPVGTFVCPNVILDGPTLPAPPVTDGENPAATRRRARLVFRGDSHSVTSPYEHTVPYDFWVGSPDSRLFPARIWQALVNQHLCTAGAISSYGNPIGLQALREAIADHVAATRLVKVSPSQVLVVNGIQEGLSIIARLFIRRGTEVAIEDPCYRGAANVFASHGARLVPVSVDRDGVDVAHLPHEAAFVYLTPSHQYPTGAVLPLERRNALLEWAERARAYVVEDDYDSDFHYDGVPLPALHGLDDRDQVIYLGTFSKSLAPGLRVGYMIVPRHLVAPATTVKALLNNCSPWIPQSVLAEFIKSGNFAHHLRRVRTFYSRRRNRLIEALEAHFGAVDLSGVHAGMHFAWHMPGDFPPAFDVERECRAAGVGVYGVRTGNAVVVDAAMAARYERTLMLGYAARTEDEIDEGVRRLAAVLGAWRAPPAPNPDVVPRRSGDSAALPLGNRAAFQLGNRDSAEA